MSKIHRVVFHANEAEPQRMGQILNNIENLLAHYREAGEEASVELVANGPGLTMLIADQSPVAERIAALLAGRPGLRFAACRNTIDTFEKRSGQPLMLIAGVEVVPAGVARLVELQEQGYAYLRP